MAPVVSCAGCERFVRSSDNECPFCGTPRAARVTKLRRPHMARAAMVAMALAGGCGTAAPVYGGPPPENIPHEEGDSTSGDSTTGDSTPDTSPDTTPEVEDEFEGGAPVPVYGAAPPE